MNRAYNVIDSDGHVLEPPDFWVNYLEPKFRDRAPQLMVDADGKERLRRIEEGFEFVDGGSLVESERKIVH